MQSSSVFNQTQSSLLAQDQMLPSLSIARSQSDPEPHSPMQSQLTNTSNIRPNIMNITTSLVSNSVQPNHQNISLSNQHQEAAPQVLLHPPVSTSPASAITRTGVAVGNNHVQSQQNGLPLPFHGLGQYTHQINPFMLKTPELSPSNSGRSSLKPSRDPSPELGLKIDSLEAQFMHGHGEQPSVFSVAQKEQPSNNASVKKPKSQGPPLQMISLAESVSQLSIKRTTSLRSQPPSWQAMPLDVLEFQPIQQQSEHISQLQQSKQLAGSFGQLQQNQQPLGQLQQNQQPLGQLQQNQQLLEQLQQNQQPLGQLQQNQQPLGQLQQNQQPLGQLQQNQQPLGQLQQNQQPLGQLQQNQQPLGQLQQNQQPLGQLQQNQQPLRHLGLLQQNQPPLGQLQQNQQPLGLLQQNQPPLGQLQQNQQPLGQLQQNQQPLRHLGLLQQNQQPLGQLQQNQQPLGYLQQNQQPLEQLQQNQQPLGYLQQNQQLLGQLQQNQQPLGQLQQNQQLLDHVGQLQPNQQPLVQASYLPPKQSSSVPNQMMPQLTTFPPSSSNHLMGTQPVTNVLSTSALPQHSRTSHSSHPAVASTSPIAQPPPSIPRNVYTKSTSAQVTAPSILNYAPSESPSQFPMPNHAASILESQLQDSGRMINLLKEKCIIPPDGIEEVRPKLPRYFNNINCSPDVFRCTLNAVPANSTLLNKVKLPLGVLIHPFKELSQLPVIQTGVIVRCRTCRSYINPFVAFTSRGKWKCNLCLKENDLPQEFYFDPESKTYGEPQQRPEMRYATIEFIAPSEYMVRPPPPAVYLFLLDVSFNAVQTGYLSEFCQVLLKELDKLPGDARTTIGFLCYDRILYYFNLAENLTRPQMLGVPDLEDLYMPSPDSLLVNLKECKELVTDLLTELPQLFVDNSETDSILGTALQAALKLMSHTGGRVTVMQTCLPTAGAGALLNRVAGSTLEENDTHIGPAIDFYKKLGLDFSARQIAVDLFMLNGQYSDLATLSCISKSSSGNVYYYPSFHTIKNPGLISKFNMEFRRYLIRPLGFESVLRIRCAKGLSIHSFHGNCFVRSTDLLALPNINSDASFGMQVTIEGKLVGSVSFQVALLYTTSKGERRIRVHTLCLPVTDQINEVFASADQLAVTSLIAKMAVDRSVNTTLRDARESIIYSSLDSLKVYSQQIQTSQQMGALLAAPYSLRMMPLLMLAMLKNPAFVLTGNIPADDRVFSMFQFKVLPVCYLVQNLIPQLYPIHQFNEEKPIQYGKKKIASAPLLPLSSASIDQTGMYLLDTGEAMYILVGSEIGSQMCLDVFGNKDFLSLPETMMDLPELKNQTSKTINNFVKYLKDSRPYGVTFLIIRGDSQYRKLFTKNLLEDKTESSMSYYEFLQYLQTRIKD